VLSLLAGYCNVFLKQKQNRFGRSVNYHSTKKNDISPTKLSELHLLDDLLFSNTDFIFWNNKCSCRKKVHGSIHDESYFLHSSSILDIHCAPERVRCAEIYVCTSSQQGLYCCEMSLKQQHEPHKDQSTITKLVMYSKNTAAYFGAFQYF
jgi:hypothetical protein